MVAQTSSKAASKTNPQAVAPVAIPVVAQAPVAPVVERAGSGERGLNLCLFIGRLGVDPELRYTPDGTPFATASLAVKSYATATKPDWIRLRFWRGAAETISKYARKGGKLQVQGKLRVHAFTDKQTGQPRTTFVIDVDEFLFLGDPGHRLAATAEAPGEDEDLAGLDVIPD